MKSRLLLLLALTPAIGIAAPQPPSAKEVVAHALTIARRDHKNVLLDFRASWCPWCVRFEKLLDDQKFASKFKDSFVIASITVREVAAHREEENLGWEAVMQGYRPTKDQDIPYIVILDGQGKKLGDSYEPAGKRIPNNAGFPQTSDEIDAYLNLLRRTAKAFTEADLADLRHYFESIPRE
jgi:thioredoxin-related protein